MGRSTTTDVRSFSIFKLKKWKSLQPECRYFGQSIVWSTNGEEVSRIGYSLSTVTGDSYMELSYKIKDWGDTEWRSIRYKIPLEAVECHYGNVRWYFRCPLYCNGGYCGRRVALMYKAGDYFGCRHCANLTYESCNEGKRFRGWPWKVLANECKADELLMEIKQTHYAGKPTKKFKQYLKLRDQSRAVYETEKGSLEEL